MTLTNFKLGQRVKIKENIGGMSDFENCVGIIVEIRMYYGVKFDSPYLCESGDFLDGALFKEEELYPCEPTDIIEYLKQMLPLEKD